MQLISFTFQRLPIPVTIAAVLYTRACITLWRVDKVAHANANNERSAVQQRQAQELAKRKRTVKMMIVCVTLFFACYAPKVILYWGKYTRLVSQFYSTFLIYLSFASHFHRGAISEFTISMSRESTTVMATSR